MIKKKKIKVSKENEVFEKSNDEGDDIEYDDYYDELLFKVVFFYDDFNVYDVVKDFNENDSFFDHFNQMFPPNGFFFFLIFFIFKVQFLLWVFFYILK
jgi:hypothetical protein